MFQKKFKVQVKKQFLTEDKYYVEFAYYRIIPFWEYLNYSICFDHNYEIISCPELLNKEDAEKVAESIKSIEDVEKYRKNASAEEKSETK